MPYVRHVGFNIYFGTLYDSYLKLSLSVIRRLTNSLIVAQPPQSRRLSLIIWQTLGQRDGGARSVLVL